VLFPVLAAVFGPVAVVAVSIAGATWAFDRLVYEQFGARGRVGTLCFAGGALLNVSIGQLPFLLGAQSPSSPSIAAEPPWRRCWPS
jgi:hypothetical protein